MAKKDYAKIAGDIIKNCGGASNIANVSHCMTRLRVQVRDKSKLNVEEAKQISGVMNLIVQNGEYQYVIGQDVPSVYEEVTKVEGIKAGGSVEDAEALKQDVAVKGKVLETVLSFIGGTLSPVIPVLVAGGLTGAVLTLLTMFAGVSAESGAYQVIYAINQATFFFLPVFVGFSAASRLKSNGYLGAFLACILLSSGINGVALDFFGLPIQAIGYNANIFPIILGVLFMSVVYRFFQKTLPVALRTIFVPLLTMLITVPVTLVVLGPIGNTVGTVLADAIYAVYNAVPAISVAFMGAFTCWFVFFGMNNALYPVCFALLAAVNSDPLVCAGMAPANVAVGGACLAVALIAKKAEERQVAAGAGVTALCGITEPGVYGVLFVKRYPLIGAMIGGGIGGFIGGLLGMTQYVISTPGFISFAAYITPAEMGGGMTNFVIAMAVMVIATVVAFAVTYLLGKKAEA